MKIVNLNNTPGMIIYNIYNLYKKDILVQYTAVTYNCTKMVKIIRREYKNIKFNTVKIMYYKYI